MSAGVLCWKARQSGLDYTTQPLPVFTTTDFADSGLVAPDFAWKAGFRLAADCTFDDRPWSAGLHLVNFCGCVHGSRTASAVDGIFPTLSFATGTLPMDYVTSARTCWSVCTTLLDIVGGRNCYANGCLSASWRR